MITLRTATLTLALLSAVVAGHALKPKLDETAPRAELNKAIPEQIGAWRSTGIDMPQVSTSAEASTPSRDQPYDDQVMRTYTDEAGHMLMLAVAYGASQRQEVKIHRPELCYPAQGLQVLNLSPQTFPLKTQSGEPVNGYRMIAQGNSGIEAVSYWIRIGDNYTNNPWAIRKTILKEGLAGKTTDGILVRVSQRISSAKDADQAFALQEKFTAQLVAATSPNGQALLVK